MRDLLRYVGNALLTCGRLASAERSQQGTAPLFRVKAAEAAVEALRENLSEIAACSPYLERETGGLNRTFEALIEVLKIHPCDTMLGRALEKLGTSVTSYRFDPTEEGAQFIESVENVDSYSPGRMIVEYLRHPELAEEAERWMLNENFDRLCPLTQIVLHILGLTHALCLGMSAVPEWAL